MTKTWWVLSGVTIFSLLACSGEREDRGIARTESAAPSVLIERVSRWDDERAYIALIRETMRSCQQAKLLAAQAHGSSYDPRAEELSDAEIVELESSRILQVFQGARYAEIRTSNTLERTHWGPGVHESCQPKAIRSKSVQLEPDACTQISISYDLEKGTGTRSELQGVCPPAASTTDPSRLSEERMGIPGTNAHCRWTADAGAFGRSCLLEPWLTYPGSGRDLTVATQFALAAHGVPVLQAVQQAVQSSEHPVRVEIDQPLPAGIFEIPADALQFPSFHDEPMHEVAE